MRPTDSPKLHQGRKRTQPHVQGQWAAHVFLECLSFFQAIRPQSFSIELTRLGTIVELDQTLHKLLKKAVEASSESFASEDIHFLFDSTTTANDGKPAGEELPTLHISLSRPLYIQTNQKSDLRASVAKVAKSVTGYVRFDCSISDSLLITGANRFSSRYASFGMLENDEKNRRFLAIEIGQGYEQVRSLVLSYASTALTENIERS